MRVVTSEATLIDDLEAVIREGKNAFGNPNVIVEQYLPDARHVEVQILGDGQGGVIHLLDRECSLQRRYQKVIEEAPVQSLPDLLRQSVLDHAVQLGKAVAYRGLGTVEFIVKDGEAYFLEVNPRIQVEHPVTEEVTGLDLVRLQIEAVCYASLPVAQEDVRERAFSVEARLYAEDPALDFTPSTGRIVLLELPESLRVDAGIEAGMSVTQYYDPMIAKLIATAPDRQAAYMQLGAALERTAVVGVQTNLPLLRVLAAEPAVLCNQVHTGSIRDFIARLPEENGVTEADAAVAAVLWLRHKRSPAVGAWNSWNELTGWRLGGLEEVDDPAPSIRLVGAANSYDVRFGARSDSGSMPVTVNGVQQSVRLGDHTGGKVQAAINGRALMLSAHSSCDQVGFIHGAREVAFRIEPHLSGMLLSGGALSDGQVLAPMMGQIISVNVELGQSVEEGDRLATIESMKMELVVRAQKAGVVSSVTLRTGDTVERDQCIFVIDSGEEEAV